MKNILTGGLLLLPIIVGAVGYSGFEPNDTNVIAPSTKSQVNSWKQAVTCGASGVQISPRWVLTSNHAGCPAGRTVRRQVGGVTVTAEVDYRVNVGGANDVSLSRLATPLPYDDAFVPLIENIWSEMGGAQEGENSWAYEPSTPEGWLKRQKLKGDVLMVGYGVVSSTQTRPLQVGWTPLALADDQGDAAPASPHLAPYPVATNGDSGGGVFLVSQAYPQGALAGVMVSGSAPGLSSSRGFGSATRANIDAVLGDPLLNPSGDSVTWVQAKDIVRAEGSITPLAPMFVNGQNGLASSADLVTSSYPSTLRVQIPSAHRNIEFFGDAVKIVGYKVKLVHESYLGKGSGFNFSTTVYPHDAARNLYIGSGIYPGKWFMTVSTLALDNQTGEQVESLAYRRTEFSIPTSRPGALKALIPTYVALSDFGDGLSHWCAEVAAVPGSGPTPEGVLWYVGNKDIPTQYDKHPLDTAGSVCSVSDPTGKLAQPGSSIEMTAFPYIGAAIGPATVIKLVAPGQP